MYWIDSFTSNSLYWRRSCKTKFSYLQRFSNYLRRFSNHETYVTIICITKFKPEFQKYKVRRCKTFCQCKRVKGPYFWKTSSWLHKLVIRTHFKHQAQYVTCVTLQNSLNFDKTLSYLAALTPIIPPYFVRFGFI